MALRGQAGFSVQRVGEYDFSSPAGRDAYAQVVARMLRSGHDGWMEDFGEYTSLDAVSSDGATGSALHNLYPALYHCAVDRLTAGRPIVRFQRSGWTGAARCADDVWGGDPTTTFGFDGLSSGPRTTAVTFSGECVDSATAPGRWTLAIRGARTRRYTLEASTLGLRPARGRGPFRTCAITVGGRALPRSAWRQTRAGVLTATFTARRATVVVRG